MITKLIRKPPWFKVWSVITAIALTIALVLTFLPYEASIDDGILSISLRQASANPGWLSGYDYRKVLNITGQSEASTNYQIKLLVGESAGATGEQFDLNSHCTDFPTTKGDSYYDIAFTDNNELTELYAWVESVSGTTPNRLATIWVKVTDDLSSGTVTTYCYYGSSTETSSSDGDNTFIFFDDFDSVITAWQAGKVGNCIDFGTGDDWVNCGNSTTANLWGAGNLTVDAWVKQTTDAVQDIIFKGDPADKWASYTLRSVTDNQSLWYQMDDGVSAKNWGGTSDVIDGTWRHVVVTLAYNGTGFDRTIYIDGIEDTPTVAGYVDTGLFNTAYPLTLGKCTYDGDPESGECYGYDGYLDELHIYSRVLDTTEVAWSYARGNAGLASNVSSTNQIGYWAFDESAGTTATDSSGNGNHGTLNGFTGSLDTAKWDDVSNGGTLVISGSKLTLTGGSGTTGAKIQSDVAHSTTGRAMRVYGKSVHSGSTSYLEALESHFGGYVSTWPCYYGSSALTGKHHTYVSDWQSTAISGWVANTYHILEQQRNATTNVIFKVDDANTVTHATQVPTTAGKLRFVATYPSAGVEVDWVFVRKYVSPEPAFSVAGSEQSFTVEITNTPASWAIGTVATSAVVYFSATGIQDDDYSLITNTGNCAVDIQIQGQNIEGGSYDWVLASSAGSEQYSLYANSEATPTVYNIEVKLSSYNNLCTGLVEDDTYNWSMKFTAPTAFHASDDGNQKSCTVTLVASEAS